mmetsp:Transcript_2825/g.8625  ORF Transcript_2825/g.8625 Transcript_2825/m.8625 type:complete len:341 (+) Transcript_2825:832-1854(+)
MTSFVNVSLTSKLRHQACEMYRGSTACMQRVRTSVNATTEGDKLITPKWLSSRLEDVTILDVRGKVRKGERCDEKHGRYLQKVEYLGLHDDYIDSHIPNATFVNWVSDIVDPASGSLYNLKQREDFIETMEEKGVSNERDVVVYDRGDMLYATRLWFALVVHGHTSVRVLNGGFTAWEREDLPISADAPCALKAYSSFVPEQERRDLLVDVDAVLSRDDDVTLIDARSTKQFTGVERRAERRGHIPGAINLDRKLLMNPDGIGFLPLEELRNVFNNLQIDLTRPAIAYCNGGVASTAVLFAMHLLGAPLDRLFNYDGSWNEYGTLPSVPVEDPSSSSRPP